MIYRDTAIKFDLQESFLKEQYNITIKARTCYKSGGLKTGTWINNTNSEKGKCVSKKLFNKNKEKYEQEGVKVIKNVQSIVLLRKEI